MTAGRLRPAALPAYKALPPAGRPDGHLAHLPHLLVVGRVAVRAVCLAVDIAEVTRLAGVGGVALARSHPTAVFTVEVG